MPPPKNSKKIEEHFAGTYSLKSPQIPSNPFNIFFNVPSLTTPHFNDMIPIMDPKARVPCEKRLGSTPLNEVFKDERGRTRSQVRGQLFTLGWTHGQTPRVFHLWVLLELALCPLHRNQRSTPYRRQYCIRSDTRHVNLGDRTWCQDCWVCHGCCKEHG